MTTRERLQVPLAIGMFAVWVACAVGALISDKLPVFVVANTPFGLVAYWVFRISGNGNGKGKDGG